MLEMRNKLPLFVFLSHIHVLVFYLFLFSTLHKAQCGFMWIVLH